MKFEIGKDGWSPTKQRPIKNAPVVKELEKAIAKLRVGHYVIVPVSEEFPKMTRVQTMVRTHIAPNLPETFYLRIHAFKDEAGNVVDFRIKRYN